VADPVVVKIGGGLLREGGLAALRAACDEVAALPGRVVVVPGGGPFADAVRAVDGLPDPVAHRLALAAMDQFGAVLAHVAPGLELVGAVEAFAGRADIPESWDVTSDSLAVLHAGAIGAREAVLLKPVDGIFDAWPGGAPIARVTADELAALRTGAVDAYLAEAVRRTGVAVTVRAPGGTGTRIAA
jgi:aspartokinase-like uncharacterized kinase